MKFVSDPMTLALALGLLGPAALDEQGLFDEGPRDSAEDRADMVRALALELEAEVDAESELVVIHSLDED